MNGILAGRSLETVERLLLSVTALCVLVISAWVTLTPPADGYEVMYRAYPGVFWSLLALGLMASGAVFLLSAVRRDGYWKIALVLVCVLYVLYNLMPVFRGWAMYGRDMADVLAHLGYVRPTLETDHLLADDFYPVVHILAAELRMFGLPLRTISPLLSALFAPLYFVGIYLLSRELTRNKWVGVVTLVCAIIPLFSKFQHTLHPNFFSFMLLPLFLFVGFRYLRNENRSYLLLLALVMALLVIFHPVTPLYALVALTVTVAVQVVYTRFYEESLDAELGTLSGYGAIGVSLCALWVVWYARFPIIQDFLNVSLDLGGGGGQSTVVQEYGTQQINAARGIVQLLTGFVDRYGPIFLVCGIAAVATLWVLVRFAKRDATYSETWFAAQFSTGVAISLVMMFKYVISFNPVRNSRYMILMATLLAGLFLFHLLRSDVLGRLPLRRIAVVSVVVLLLAAIPVGVTNSYQPRYHMTFAEKEGSDWFYDNWERDSLAVSHQTSYKMRMFLQGGSYQNYYNTSQFEDITDRSPVPRDFGYRTNETLGETVNGRQTYLVTKTYDTEYYETIAEFTRDDHIVYDESSLDRLATDATVDKIYTNGGYTVWFVGESADGAMADNESANRVSRSGGQRYNPARRCLSEPLRGC